MSLRKIEPSAPGGVYRMKEPVFCNAPGHTPPAHLSLQPGDYEWTCETCGKTFAFVVTGVFMRATF